MSHDSAWFILILIGVISAISPLCAFCQVSQQSYTLSATSTTEATSGFELPNSTLQDWETDLRNMMDVSLDTDFVPRLFPSPPAIANASVTQPTMTLHHIKLSLVVGRIAGIHLSDGNPTFVRQGEVLHDPELGYLQISNINPQQIEIQHLSSDITISIPKSYETTTPSHLTSNHHTLRQTQQPDTIQFQLDTTIVPDSPLLNYRFNDSLRLQNLELSHFLNLLHKITSLEFSFESQDHQSLRPTTISIELEQPTLREVLMTALPPVGLWFEINQHEITLFALKSRLK